MKPFLKFIYRQSDIILSFHGNYIKKKENCQVFCYYKFISTQCHCYFLLYFQIYCNIYCLIPLNQHIQLSKLVGRGLHTYAERYLHTSDLRLQNSDFTVGISDIEIWISDLQSSRKNVVHTGPNHLFQNYFNREDCTGGHV